MEDIKLVICDIDSTLVNDHRQMMPLTKAMIDQLHKQGKYFGIASGRPIDELEKYGPAWGFDFDFDIIIGMNGGELKDNISQKFTTFFELSEQVLKDVIELMKPLDINFFMYLDGYILAKRDNEMLKKSAKSSDKKIVIAKDEKEFYKKPNAKLMFRVDDEKEMGKVEEYVSKHNSDAWVGYKTQPTLFEFCDPRAQKDYGLIEFCKRHKLSLDEVMAFGDTTNDNELLKSAGVGVCMINGSDDTKVVSDVISEYSNNEDGVGHFLADHVFK